MSQLTYTQTNPVAYEGMVAYPDAFIVSKGNATTQLVSVVFTAANSALYRLNINGVPFDYTSDGSATATEIRDGLKAVIDAGTQKVLTTTLSTNGLYIESTDPYNAFSINATGSATPSNSAITVLVNQGQGIPFGRAVCWDELGYDADSCRLPRLSTDVSNRIFGVTKGDSSIETIVGATSGLYSDKSIIPVVRKGYIWVITESAITAVGAAVYVRFSAGSGGSNLGAFRGDDDTSTAAVLTGASFRTTAEANQLVMLEVNLTY